VPEKKRYNTTTGTLPDAGSSCTNPSLWQPPGSGPYNGILIHPAEKNSRESMQSHKRERHTGNVASDSTPLRDSVRSREHIATRDSTRIGPGNTEKTTSRVTPASHKRKVDANIHRPTERAGCSRGNITRAVQSQVDAETAWSRRGSVFEEYSRNTTAFHRVRTH